MQHATTNESNYPEFLAFRLWHDKDPQDRDYKIPTSEAGR